MRIVIESQFVWVFVGHVAEKIAGVRSGVRLVSEKMRSHAARCLACDQYNLFDLLVIDSHMRKYAVRCGGAKITFRVRCIQPGSATSPRCNSSAVGDGWIVRRPMGRWENQPVMTAHSNPDNPVHSQPILPYLQFERTLPQRGMQLPAWRRGAMGRHC